MGEKTIEQVQAESKQIQSFYNAVIDELKVQIANLSHELALQKAMNSDKEQAIRDKDTNIQSLTTTIEELEKKISASKEEE